MASNALEMFDRVENFVVIQSVNFMSKLLFAHTSQYDALTLVMALYACTYSFRRIGLGSGEHKNFEQMLNVFLQTEALMMANILIKIINLNERESSPLFMDLITCTVLICVLIGASVLPKNMNACLDRTILLVMYLFADTLTFVATRVDIGISSVVIAVVGIVGIDKYESEVSEGPFGLLMQASSMTFMNMIFDSLPAEHSNTVYLLMVLGLVFFSYILEQCGRQQETWHRVREYAIYTVARTISPRYAKAGLDTNIAGVLSLFVIGVHSMNEQMGESSNSIILDLLSLVAVDRIISWISDSVVLNTSSPNILILFFYIILLSCSRSLFWPGGRY